MADGDRYGGPMQRSLLLPATIFPIILALACWTAFINPPPIDFVSFWSAAQRVLHGDALGVYSYQPSGFGRLMPIAYPPPFLLWIAPFGLVDFGSAFLGWTLITGSLYLIASSDSRRLALASPPALSNGLVGQNGFLTTGVFLLGLRILPARPLIAGMSLGLLVIKPQLAVLLPIALIAGRHWVALIGAAVSAATALGLAVLLLGAEAYVGFAGALAQYSIFLERGRWPWNELASVFALVRWFGANGTVALAFQLCAAVAAAVTVWIAWRNDWQAKVPVVAAATLLVSPYLFTYDAVLLVAPLAWLATRTPGWNAAVWCLSLLPLLRGVGYAGPNGISVAAAVALAVIVSLHLRNPASPLEPQRA